MKRLDSILEKDIARWSDNIDNDPNIPKSILSIPLMREVCMAGLYLAEELSKLECPENLIIRIQHTAGRLSFGRDIWETHQSVLESYKNNELDFEDDGAQIN